MLTRRFFVGLTVLLVALLAWGCSSSDDGSSADQPAAAQPAAAAVLPADAASLEVSSPVFSEIRPRKRIPHENTCYGANVSPPLQWSGVPEGAGSLALIMEDLDDQEDRGVHWVLYNIPPDVTELPEGISTSTEVLPDGMTQGTNDSMSLGYSGPCPTVVVMQYSEHFSKNTLAGPHTYAFTVYALDAMLELGPAATRAELMGAMQGHVLAKGETMGKYAATLERKVYGSES